jgi:AcrR family transcriptional regulator
VFQLAAVMEDRSQRIVETAIELAEQGGFEAVRLRDVASHAGVALGTLYRRFRSKEDLLVAALDLETLGLERRVLQRPPRGDTPLERVVGFFSMATRGMCRRPQLARALIRACAAGEPELSQKVASFHGRMENLIILSLRGKPCEPNGEPGHPAEPLSEEERTLAWSIELVWFGLLVGWSGGLHTQSAVVDQTRAAASLMLNGARQHSPTP